MNFVIRTIQQMWIWDSANVYMVVVLRWTVWLSTVVAVCGDGLADEDLQ